MITLSDILLVAKYAIAIMIVVTIVLAPAWLARQTAGYDSGSSGQLDIRLDGHRMALVIILVIKKIIPHPGDFFTPPFNTSPLRMVAHIPQWEHLNAHRLRAPRKPCLRGWNPGGGCRAPRDGGWGLVTRSLGEG